MPITKPVFFHLPVFIPFSRRVLSRRARERTFYIVHVGMYYWIDFKSRVRAHNVEFRLKLGQHYEKPTTYYRALCDTVENVRYHLS